MKGLLKFITCGSVDDGKSTLIGHILYDSKLLYADQEKALELDSKVGSREGKIDYSLLLDGLMAEREQGITIDVAYRYFTTDNRSFIVADTPGHEEYTRNMAVGASFADLAIILIDAKQGLLLQTKRHARICSLMGIKYFVFAINKMDLVGYNPSIFKEIEEQIKELAQELSLENVKIIPVSATEGDNITRKSDNMPWYTGEALLPYLEDVDINQYLETGFYMPVQRVSRPNHEFRGFQGQIEAGEVTVGDKIISLPSKENTLIEKIYIGDKESEKAVKGQPVTIQLNREVDVSRGCVLTKETEIKVGRYFYATLLWMDNVDLKEGKEYLIKLGTKLIPGVISKIEYVIDVNNGLHTKKTFLSKNEIGLCEVLLSDWIAVDEFHRHKTLGELILIDRISNMTSACGIVKKLGKLNEEGDKQSIFTNGEISARGDIFQEFYYNLDSQNILKRINEHPTYSVGDSIPIKGESYEYPNDVDILILRDQVAIKVRNQSISEISKLADYSYSGYPVINGRGFEIKINSQEETSQFLNEIEDSKGRDEVDIVNKWMRFDTYKRVKFH